jgi:hypothetical protein
MARQNRSSADHQMSPPLQSVPANAEDAGMGQNLNLAAAGRFNRRIASGFQSRPEDYFAPHRETTKPRRAILGRTIVPRRPLPPPPRHYGVRYQALMWAAAFILLRLYYRI